MNDEEIFRAGSTTYYFSSKFFPKGVRDDVFKLYSFVRIVDDLIDQDKPDRQTFEHIEKRWKHIKKNLGKELKKADDSVYERVLMNIAFIVHRYECDPAWIDAFLKSMRMDLEKRRYKKIDQTLEYIYGSAEVIGLCMARILRLKEASYESAKMQGRAMQFINFIRDINEDNAFGRQYFPDEDLAAFGLKDLSEHETAKKPAEFREFIEYQVKRYNEWQKEASKGFKYIPKRMRIAVRTAVDMYMWTGKKLAENPSLIYEKKLKPSRGRVVRTGMKRTIYG